MPDPKQLPHLIKLLDDESENVRRSVMEELTAYGSSLQGEMVRLNITLSDDQEQLLQDLLAEQRRVWLKESWPSWISLRDDKLKLESALSLLAQFIGNRRESEKLGSLLDRLAEEFKSTYLKQNTFALAEFLFERKGIRGASSEDYHNPDNSDLIYAIKDGKGLPITLACVYILVGHRLGMEIEGCNSPGHFLAIARAGENRVVIDCYDGGRMIDRRFLGLISKASTFTLDDLIRLQCNAETIIGRVLRNLTNAYHQADENENAKLMGELLQMTQETEAGP